MPLMTEMHANAISVDMNPQHTVMPVLIMVLDPTANLLITIYAMFLWFSA